eukprot:scaffold3960_cov116-Isochrysis_galbana.AAC.9
MPARDAHLDTARRRLRGLIRHDHARLACVRSKGEALPQCLEHDARDAATSTHLPRRRLTQYRVRLLDRMEFFLGIQALLRSERVGLGRCARGCMQGASSR